MIFRDVKVRSKAISVRISHDWNGFTARVIVWKL